VTKSLSGKETFIRQNRTSGGFCHTATQK